MKRHIYILIGFATFLFLLASCSSSRYLPEGKYLLAKNEIEITEKKKEISKSNVRFYIRQQENKRSLFGWKFHLSMYSGSPRCDSCWLGNFMKKIGEPPVVFEPDLVDNSVENIENYLRSLGYYYADVKDSVRYKKHKANVTYIIKPGETFTLRNISYQLEDDHLSSFILRDTTNSLIKKGSALSINLLEQESERIELFLQNEGFYEFNRSLVSYMVDTSLGNMQANLTMLFFRDETPETIDSMQYNKRFRIRNVNVLTEYDAVEASTNANYMNEYSAFTAKNFPDGEINLWYREKQKIRTNVLLDALTVNPGDYYSITDNNQTYNNLTGLRLFRNVYLLFNKVSAPEGDTLVDCIIQLLPNTTQSFNIKMEASISSLGLLGLSPNISYNHRNLFKGGEWLNVTFSENFQFDPFNISNASKRSNELALSASISTPKFLLPHFHRYFKTYTPRTEFTTAYGYQLRPEYTRNSLSFLLGYNWRTKPQLSYTLNILNLNIVKLYNVSDDFYNSTVKDPYLRNRYENHFVLGANASFVYSTRQASNTSNSILFRWNIGFAGNLLSLFNEAMNTNDNGNRLLLGTPYSQYAKTDINFSHYLVFNKKQSIAYRFFAGVGKAYGNSISLPYEEVYFSGGAYSLRGWQLRSVGPGAAPIDTTFSIPNQVGDFKLEANVEYRFNMIGVLDGAIFFDAGNIWSLNYNEADESAVLKGSNFFKQIALNTGFGLRLNLGFTVIRIDVGAKLYEPRLYSGWIARRNIFAIDNMSLHFGIGYPF